MDGFIARATAFKHRAHPAVPMTRNPTGPNRRGCIRQACDNMHTSFCDTGLEEEGETVRTSTGFRARIVPLLVGVMAAASSCVSQEACYENDDGVLVCPDAGYTPPDAGRPDANLGTPDAGADAGTADAGRDAGQPDAAPVDLPGRVIQAFVRDVAPLINRVPGTCTRCHAGQFPLVNYLAVLEASDGGPDQRQSILAYKHNGERPYLVDLVAPSRSLLVTKGAHTGPALTRSDSERAGVVAWAALERQLACETGAFDCSPQALDAGPPPTEAAVTNSRLWFEEWVLTTLLRQNCQYCHSVSNRYLDPGSQHLRPVQLRTRINFLDAVDSPYESFSNYVSLLGLQLYDFTTPSNSLLLTKGEHQVGEGRPYGTAAEQDKYLLWVALEQQAQRYRPLPDAGPPPDAAVRDAGTPPDAAVRDSGPTPDGAVPDSGPVDAGDLTAAKAAARESFFNTIYVNLVRPTRPDALCVTCHVQGATGARPFMVRAGDSAALAEERYRTISQDRVLVNLETPSASLLLLKDQNHFGGQGFVRANSAEADRGKFLAWVALERVAQGFVSRNINGGGACETQFYPNAPPANSTEGAETQVDLAYQLCRPDLQGAALSVAGSRLGTGLEFSYLTLIAPPQLAMHVEEPVFTRWTRLDQPDGGYAYAPREQTYVAPGYKADLAPNSITTVFSFPGVFIPGFFGLGGNPNVGGLTSFLSVEFRRIEVSGEAKDGGVASVDAGPRESVPCLNLAGFEASVVPAISTRATPALAACTDCHGSQGFVFPRAFFNLETLPGDTAAACSELRRWVNPEAPAQSHAFTVVNPVSVGNAHGWWFPSTGTDFETFRSTLEPWIASERATP
jgi:hypothetical protein